MIEVISKLDCLEKVYKRWGLENSPAIRCGDLYFVGGIAAIDLNSAEPSEGDITTQAGVAMDSVAQILADLGLSLDNVVKVNATLTYGKSDFPGWNAVFRERFNSPFPVRTTVGGEAAVGRIEIEVVAAVESRMGE